MKMNKKEIIRIGSLRSEIDAARIYDFLAILTDGLNVSLFLVYHFLKQAKTNFDYTVKHLIIIVKEFYFKNENSIGYNNNS